MARRKRNMSESPPTDTDSPDDVSSPSILGSMLSLDEEMSQKPTKSPRKSHIPIYDPAKEPSPTKSPRPPKRKTHPPPPDNDGAILQQDSVFVPTNHDNDDNRPPKPAAVRLDFPNNVTATPPPLLTQSEREPAASPRKAKAPHGYASLHKANPAATTSHVKSDHRAEAPEPTNSSSTSTTSPAAAADNTEGYDVVDYDDQIAIVMRELEALNLLHSQLLEAQVKAKEHHHRKHHSSVHIASTDALLLQTTSEPPPQAISNPKSPRRPGNLANKDVKTTAPQVQTKSPKKPRQLKPEAAVASAGLPPLSAYPMAAVQDAYPWSKFMLQQMHQQMMQSPHHVHGASTPVVYVPILNPAYMAEVKHPPSDKQTKPAPPPTDTAPTSSKAPDEVAPAEDTTAIAAKSPDKPPKPRTIKKASPKRPAVVKKHTSRELVFPR